MSWQQPDRPASADTAAIFESPYPADHPVIVRTAQAMVFLGRIRGDGRGPSYGHAVVLRDSRPIYSWPREGLHHVAAYAADVALGGLRLGPAIHEHWLADVRTVWGLTEDGYARVAALEAVSHADTTEADPDPRPAPNRAMPDPVVVTASAGIAHVAAAALRRADELVQAPFGLVQR